MKMLLLIFSFSFVILISSKTMFEMIMCIFFTTIAFGLLYSHYTVFCYLLIIMVVIGGIMVLLLFSLMISTNQMFSSIRWMNILLIIPIVYLLGGDLEMVVSSNLMNLEEMKSSIVLFLIFVLLYVMSITNSLVKKSKNVYVYSK